jgi:hypothetical protein
MVCGVDNAFTLDKFKQEFSIDVTAIGAPSRRNSRRARSALRRSPAAHACSPRALHTHHRLPALLTQPAGPVQRSIR